MLWIRTIYHLISFVHPNKYLAGSPNVMAYFERVGSKEEPIAIWRSKCYGDKFLAIRSCFGPLVQIESHGYVIHIGNRSSCAKTGQYPVLLIC